MKKRWIVAFSLICCLIFTGCVGVFFERPEISASIREEEQFDSPQVLLSQEEFEAAGFQLGDSCDVEFSNGFSLEDIPYYNGYYAKTGDPLIVAYPGNDYLAITYCNSGLWSATGLQEGDIVTIRLNESGKYSSVQEALGQHYSFERKDYPTDEAFCNFRSLSGGALAKDKLFRSSSPLLIDKERSLFVDALLEKQGIGFILDLADSPEDENDILSHEDLGSRYAVSLIADGNSHMTGLSASYQSDDYCKGVADCFKYLLTSETSGPICIFCSEGKDRTGFVCMLLEALAGASYEEMLYDYMVTYQNYCNVTPDKTPEKYKAIEDLYFKSFIDFLHGSSNEDELATADFSADAKAYLASGGMSDAEIEALYAFVTDSAQRG